MAIEASWAVRYKDGTLLAQYDASSEHFSAEGQEVPFKAIDWPNVAHVIFESQYDRMELPLAPAGPGKTWSLRARVTMGVAGSSVRVFILLHSVAGVPVDEHSVDKAVYWTPTGILHTCRFFDCSSVRAYTQQLVHGRAAGAGLMPRHDLVDTLADTILA